MAETKGETDMLGICRFLAGSLNVLICILGLVEFALMLVSWQQLESLKKRIDRMNGKPIRKLGHPFRKGKGEVSTTYVQTSDKSWYEFDKFLSDYQNKGIIYSMFSMIVQVFTLLGILGTVAGLYIAMNEGNDIYAGVEFALSSTVLGIIFAVIYKVADILMTSFYINYIEDGIDRFEKEFKVDVEDSARMNGTLQLEGQESSKEVQT